MQITVNKSEAAANWQLWLAGSAIYPICQIVGIEQSYARIKLDLKRDATVSCLLANISRGSFTLTLSNK